MYALASLQRPSGVPWSSPLLRGRRGAMCAAKGSGLRPSSVPCLVSAAFAWQAWDNVHCQGAGCTPWRPSGVPPVSLGFRGFCVAGVGQCALPRGRMYALASLRCPLVSAAFAWQAWDNVHCQGAGCTPWRPSGVPPVSLGLRRFCMAGVGQCALPRGRMYALASLRCPLVSAAFAWQAWDNVHCQGVRPGVPPVSLGLRRFCVAGVGQYALPRVGCTPWRPSGVPPVSLGLRRFCVAGVGQCALPGGRMHAPSSLFFGSGACLPSSLFFGSGACLPSSLFFLSSGQGFFLFHHDLLVPLGSGWGSGACLPFFSLLWLRCLSPFFSLLSFLGKGKGVLLHHDLLVPPGSGWGSGACLPSSLFFLSSGQGFCSIIICWFLLVPAGVPVLVSLLLSSFFPQERGSVPS